MMSVPARKSQALTKHNYRFDPPLYLASRPDRHGLDPGIDAIRSREADRRAVAIAFDATEGVDIRRVATGVGEPLSPSGAGPASPRRDVRRLRRRTRRGGDRRRGESACRRPFPPASSCRVPAPTCLGDGPARLSSPGAARAVRVAAGRPRQPCPDRSLGSAETIRALLGARRGRAPAPPPQPAPHAARMRERPLPSVFSCSN
jgi:hypothetical protein